ncbi:MAG: hypothetical protein IPM64_02870 [Phycisphaerales bacterium]|nr:hypothetical protein [Phycisphaerales bacterium]
MSALALVSMPARRSASALAALLFLPLCLLPHGPTALAQELEPLVAAALDQTVSALRIEDRPVRDALAVVEERTGVRTIIADEVLALLPYGSETRISITLDGVPLRRGMQRAFVALGLDFRVEGDRVLLEPAPLLQRLGRRLAIEESQLLERLATSTVEFLREADAPILYRLDPATRPQERFHAALGGGSAGSALQRLDSACEALEWSWLVDGPAIVLTTREAEVRRRLDAPMNLRYQRMPLDELLMALGRQAGVRISIEPGCLQAVAAREQIVDLVQRQMSLGQALELIGGSTGLRQEVSAAGVRILAPASGAASGAAADGAGRDPGRRVVAHMVMETDGGASILLPIREGELTPAEVERLEARRIEGIRLLRERLGASRP